MSASHWRWQTNLTMLMLATALAGYLLPWLVATSASLTLNAYDLAEWVSLHPTQRITSPPLLATLLLRLQLPLLCLMLALAGAVMRRRWLPAAGIVLLAIAQLPPPEFLLDPGNLNYRQQFGLALLSLVASLLCLPLRSSRIRSPLLMALPLVGMLSAALGMSQAQEVFAMLQPGASVGLGFWLLMASYAAASALAIYCAVKAMQART